MAFKDRIEPVLLKKLRILNTRMEMTEDDRKYYLNQEKGYEGEVQFDSMTEKLQSECYILNDLLLKVFNTTFQIDTILLFQDTIYLIDVKSFEGEYCYDKDSFHTRSGRERKNPLHQLNRGKSLFRQLLQELGYQTKVEAYAIFINPEFTLYQAPPDLPFILPTQLQRFLKKLDSNPSQLKPHHKKLAEKLRSLHQSESSYYSLPPYEYDQLKKGLTCKSCKSFLVSLLGKHVVCGECGCKELIESSVIHCIEEYILLFPNRKITTREICEWCNLYKSKRTIIRILNRNFKVVRSGRSTQYEPKD
ncbi:MAG TPA: nuclease-related domain-containing protein [Pseudoneobacillus sp.]|nr:nuclease-related domain-containing protein [Pseudoneobacillus sp.]